MRLTKSCSRRCTRCRFVCMLAALTFSHTNNTAYTATELGVIRKKMKFIFKAGLHRPTLSRHCLVNFRGQMETIAIWAVIYTQIYLSIKPCEVSLVLCLVFRPIQFLLSAIASRAATGVVCSSFQVGAFCVSSHRSRSPNQIGID